MGKFFQTPPVIFAGATIMKTKKTTILLILLLITSLFGYLEWGGGNQMFLWEGEFEVLRKLIRDPGSVVHPLTILPLCGQILILITLFQQTPRKVLIFSAVICTGLLPVFMFVIGWMSLNVKMLISVIPFLTVAWFLIQHTRKGMQTHLHSTQIESEK